MNSIPEQNFVISVIPDQPGFSGDGSRRPMTCFPALYESMLQQDFLAAALLPNKFKTYYNAFQQVVGCELTIPDTEENRFRLISLVSNYSSKAVPLEILTFSPGQWQHECLFYGLTPE